MIVDRIWLRMKGHLLSLKEDWDRGGDARKQAEEFLERLEKKAGFTNNGPDSESDIRSRLEALEAGMRDLFGLQAPEGRQEAQGDREGSPFSIEEAERALVELKTRLSERKDEGPAKDPPPPNPRILG